MSFISAVFDPASPPAGSTATFVAGYPTGVFQMLVHNESNQNLKLSWGSNSVYAKAWEVSYFCVQSNQSVINWSIQSTLTGGAGPISQVLVEVYGPNEQIVGTYPVAINRNIAIGNSLNVATSTTSLVNDSNTVGTQIIESTPTGALSSTISVLNDGTVVIQGDVAGVLTALLATIPGAAAGASSLQLGDAARTVEVLGTLKVDKGANFGSNSMVIDNGGNITKVGSIKFKTAAASHIQYSGSAEDLINGADGVNLIVNALSGKVYIDVGGLGVGSFDSSGNLVITGTLTQNGVIT